MKFRVVIPARMGSQRLPGKPLCDVAGRPLVLRTADRARDSGAQSVVIATDDERIAKVCRADGLDVVMTDSKHQSGTDRIAEVTRIRKWSDDNIIVNVQGDEPCLPPLNISQVAGLLAGGTADIATLSTPLNNSAELHDSNIVKVIVDQNGLAMYFSRAAIPWSDNVQRSLTQTPQRHIGIYAYRVGALQRFATTPPCELERLERLEQLRALWSGWPVAVATATRVPGPGVDTAADLKAVCRLFASDTALGER
ncbi:MAG: 3-deoxy-manno-octulosonate cytidylyltransferase [Gammaproteobacteria bacterium]|nr:3-deoxy-manno-octulosonate cytidylyltransferase [Gammaproteobacteria bacterium]